MQKIELLSPAKNIECGIAAINHGADAVYIGASKLGARSAATNSIEDLEKISKYAHKFNSKVYAAVNVILKDEEIKEAEKLAWQLYNIGVDALIIQDFAFMEMNLPPIPLHSSTQMDNRTIEKVKFLENAGYSQIVLARELDLKTIKEIAANTNVSLEVFIHGALCVSYSGQCYMSEELFCRSANRGECAQCCRLPYDLIDNNGNTILKSKYLLSIKDMNRSSSLKDLIEAGISSFKIEGRLKDINYVKNITAYYRTKIDNILENKKDINKSSSGKITLNFTPNPEKSFNRGSTEYFLHGRKNDIESFETPKSKGEYLGNVTKISKNVIEINTQKIIHNGDGLCFLDNNSKYSGFRINRTIGQKKIVVIQMPNLSIGTKLYRNLDIEFQKKIKNKDSSIRKINIDIEINDNEKGFELKASDEDGNIAIEDIYIEKQKALQPEKILENIKTQFSKLGDSYFEASSIKIDFKEPFFIPNSLLTIWRRNLIKKLEFLREKNYKREIRKNSNNNYKTSQKEITYLGNINNEKAKEFLIKHGAEKIDNSFEKGHLCDVPLMFTKHCLKYSLGACHKNSDKHVKELNEPLILKYKEHTFKLKFDCKKCEMQIIKK